MNLRSTKLSRPFYSIYTLLCAVLRERLGKPHAGRMCVAPALVRLGVANVRRGCAALRLATPRLQMPIAANVSNV